MKPNKNWLVGGALILVLGLVNWGIYGLSHISLLSQPRVVEDVVKHNIPKKLKGGKLTYCEEVKAYADKYGKEAIVKYWTEHKNKRQLRAAEQCFK